MVRETRISPGAASAATRGAGVHRDAADLAAGAVFHLAGMHPGADPQAQSAHAVAHGLGAGDRPRRAVEHGQRAVAGGVASWPG